LSTEAALKAVIACKESKNSSDSRFNQPVR